jgi:hypothetical protein
VLQVIHIGVIDVGAPLQSLFPSSESRFTFRPWDGTHHLKYFLDLFVGRFKGAASELTLQCTEEKEVRERKVQ